LPSCIGYKISQKPFATSEVSGEIEIVTVVSCQIVD